MISSYILIITTLNIYPKNMMSGRSNLTIKCLYTKHTCEMHIGMVLYLLLQQIRLKYALHSERNSLRKLERKEIKEYNHKLKLNNHLFQVKRK